MFLWYKIDGIICIKYGDGEMVQWLSTCCSCRGFRSLPRTHMMVEFIFKYSFRRSDTILFALGLLACIWYTFRYGIYINVSILICTEYLWQYGLLVGHQYFWHLKVFLCRENFSLQIHCFNSYFQFYCSASVRRSFPYCCASFINISVYFLEGKECL